MADISTETTSSVAAEVPDYPMARAAGCPLAPPPEVLALNAVKPLSRVRIWDGSTPWLITGYEAIRALFTDSRASVDDRKPGYPHWNEGMLATVDKRPRSVFTSDAEEHTRFRRMLSKPFTFKRVEGLRPAVQKITDDHIDAILAGPQPADLVETLSLPVPSLVISQLLGVPYSDADFFQEQASREWAATRAPRSRPKVRPRWRDTSPSLCAPRWKTLVKIWCPIWPSGSTPRSSASGRR